MASEQDGYEELSLANKLLVVVADLLESEVSDQNRPMYTILDQKMDMIREAVEKIMGKAALEEEEERYLYSYLPNFVEAP
jgi:hypothetical protein